MAALSSKSIYILARRDELPHEINSIVGASVSYTDYSDFPSTQGEIP